MNSSGRTAAVEMESAQNALELIAAAGMAALSQSAGGSDASVVAAEHISNGSAIAESRAALSPLVGSSGTSASPIVYRRRRGAGGGSAAGNAGAADVSSACGAGDAVGAGVLVAWCISAAQPADLGASVPTQSGPLYRTLLPRRHSWLTASFRLFLQGVGLQRLAAVSVTFICNQLFCLFMINDVHLVSDRFLMHLVFLQRMCLLWRAHAFLCLERRSCEPEAHLRCTRRPGCPASTCQRWRARFLGELDAVGSGDITTRNIWPVVTRFAKQLARTPAGGLAQMRQPGPPPARRSSKGPPPATIRVRTLAQDQAYSFN
jgi:hypothetical protein